MQRYDDLVEDDLKCKGRCLVCGEIKYLVHDKTCGDCIRDYPIKKGKK